MKLSQRKVLHLGGVAAAYHLLSSEIAAGAQQVSITNVTHSRRMLIVDRLDPYKDAAEWSALGLQAFLQ